MFERFSAEPLNQNVNSSWKFDNTNVTGSENVKTRNFNFTKTALVMQYILKRITLTHFQLRIIEFLLTIWLKLSINIPAAVQVISDISHSQNRFTN